MKTGPRVRKVAAVICALVLGVAYIYDRAGGELLPRFAPKPDDQRVQRQIEYAQALKNGTAVMQSSKSGLIFMTMPFHGRTISRSR